MESKFANNRLLKTAYGIVIKNRPVDLSSAVPELNSIASYGPFDLVE